MSSFKHYETYEDLRESEPKIYEELSREYDTDEDGSGFYVYDSLEDFAHYETTEGYLFGEIDVFSGRGPLALEAYIDFESLGEDLSHIADSSVYFFSSTGKVVENIEGGF